MFAPVGPAIEPGSAINADKLKPSGERYEALVPDTLDLAERVRLSVHGLTSFLNERAYFAPYGHTYFNGNPPYMSDVPGGPPNWGKIAESLVMTRLMCGSEENCDVDAKMIRGMLASQWMKLNPEAPTPVSRAMLALLTVYQLEISIISLQKILSHLIFSKMLHLQRFMVQEDRQEWYWLLQKWAIMVKIKLT